jgi:uncharacterized protein (DUF3084 family)
MLAKKKTKLGFQPKHRTKQEIDQDYTHHAVQIGHKARVIAQLEEEVADHVEKLKHINAEAMALPPEAVAPAPEATPVEQEKGEEHA